VNGIAVSLLNPVESFFVNVAYDHPAPFLDQAFDDGQPNSRRATRYRGDFTSEPSLAQVRSLTFSVVVHIYMYGAPRASHGRKLV
jgi:hypothetical protein